MQVADFPHVDHTQYPNQRYLHPLLHHTSSTHSLHRGNSQYMPQDYLVNYNDIGYSSNSNIHDHITNINQYGNRYITNMNQYGNRNSEFYRASPYTNIPESDEYLHAIHERAQPLLQNDFRQITEKVASERHEGAHQSTVDRENMEKAFF
jgi:hypothetical protein